MDKKDIEKDFSFLKEREGVLAVLLFGSQAGGKIHERSDIDICVVAPEENSLKLWLEIDRKLKAKEEGYDFHIFKDLSIKMKHEIIQTHQIIFCKNRAKLEEYFYFYRKLWKDQAIAREVY